MMNIIASLIELDYALTALFIANIIGRLPTHSEKLGFVIYHTMMNNLYLILATLIGRGYALLLEKMVTKL